MVSPRHFPLRCQDLSNVQPTTRLDVNTAQLCPQLVFFATRNELRGADWILEETLLCA